VPFFDSALKNGARVRGLAVKGGAALSRKDVDQLAETAKQLGSSGLAWVKRQGEQISGSVGKHFTAAALGALGVGDGDVALLAVGPDRLTSPVLDRVRREVIRRLGTKPTATHAFAWVVDFPLFEPDPESGQPVFAHHAFTSPHPDDLAGGKLDSDPFACRALHYDAVYNGNELGSGSIRIIDPAVQRRIVALLGLAPADAEARFGFLLHGPQSGAPPPGLRKRERRRAAAACDGGTGGSAEAGGTVRAAAGQGGRGGRGERGGPGVDGEYKIILPGLRRVIAPKTAGQRDYLHAIAQ